MYLFYKGEKVKMDDFSKYFKSMLEQLMKSGIGGNELNFDLKGFDANASASSPFFQMFFGGMPSEKKEKLAVKKLTDEEINQYKDLLNKKDEIQSQFRRLINQQKKLEADFELFWQDIKDFNHIKVEQNQLSIDIESGFLFQEVNVNDKNKQDK
jgi:hypothetical protein